MRFDLGSVHPGWLERPRFEGIPLFVSRMRLAGYTSRLRTRTRWALDPGAFSEIKTHGRWTVPPRQYAREARGWQDEVGMMGRAAVQDWMCEPEMLGRTGLPVPEHRARTTRSLLEVRGLEPGVRWTPVLQGWDGDDSLRHADQYARAGVDLARGPVVEVASVCPRENTESADRLMPVLHRLGIRTHGFGFKTDGLARADRHMESADRMAWSHAARFRPVRLPECEHPWPTCEYCPT